MLDTGPYTREGWLADDGDRGFSIGRREENGDVVEAQERE
jgi:hypothetical protein